MKNFFKSLVIILTSISLVCCSYKPILSEQNPKYLEVGEEQAQRDAEDCAKQADKNLDKYRSERMAKEGVRKGAIGAFFGTVFGFLFGGNLRSTLGGAVIGAGIGASAGVFSVAGEGRLTPSEAKQRLETRCLQAKGYEVIGWR